MCLRAPKPRDRDRNESPPRSARVTRRRQSARSVSRYDDEHVIGSSSTVKRPQYIYGPGGDIVDVSRDKDDAEPPTPTHLRTSAPSTSRYDDEHLISSNQYHVNSHGTSKSVSTDDDEHVVSSKALEDGTPKIGLRDLGLLGMFSKQSSHGKEREGKRIGEKLVGNTYGPGSSLTGKSSAKPKRAAEKGEVTARPKEYGF